MSTAVDNMRRDVTEMSTAVDNMRSNVSGIEGELQQVRAEMVTRPDIVDMLAQYREEFGIHL